MPALPRMVRRVARAAERLLPPATRARRAAQREAARARAQEERRLERIDRRRRALLDGRADLARFTLQGEERIGRRVEVFDTSAASAANLRLVADAAESAGIDYFLVPGRVPTRYVVGMHHRDKKRFLTEMREAHRGGHLYAAKPAAGGALKGEPDLYADGALSDRTKQGRTIRFGEYLLGPRDQLLAGLEHGCDVEFWRSGDEVASEPQAVAALRVQASQATLAESLVAPRRNRVADVLPASEHRPAVRIVEDRRYPTVAAFARTGVDEVGFPIDAVYTWVDGDDPVLAEKRRRYRGEAPASTPHLGASRYTSRDELRYSLRSLAMYAPFIRHVYIVTDGQVPWWLDPNAPGITVVDHRDIFRDPDALPVFNSHAIGSQLHNIADLSERYVYFNDDVFIGRPIGAEHFFHGNGIAKVPFSSFQIGTGRPRIDEPAPNSAGKNVRDLMEQAHGRFLTHKFKHVPHPQIRGVFSELEAMFPEQLERTARSRFRDPDDIAVAGSLHHHHALLTGRAVAGDFQLRYIDIAAEDAGDRMCKLAADRDFDFFCLNDVDTPAERQDEASARVGAFLESYFPCASPFEKE